MMSLLNIHARHKFRLPEGLVLLYQVMRAAVLRIRIRIRDSRSGAFLTPGSGIRDPK